MPHATLRNLYESSSFLRLSFCLFALANLLYAQAQSRSAESNRPGDSNEALIRLVTVDRFALGPTGYAGTQSPGEADYETIFSRPSALAEFETIYLVGDPEARAYALFGIHHLSMDAIANSPNLFAIRASGSSCKGDVWCQWNRWPQSSVTLMAAYI